MPTANTATSAKTQQQQPADNKSKSFQQNNKQSTKQSFTKQSTGEESVSSTSHQSETNVDQLNSNNQETNMTTNNVASTTAAASGVKTPPEQPEFIKQALIIIEKKVRNLEKRRQKLEEYKETQRKGTVLNEDQLSAVSRYDEVIRTLDLSREMEKQFIGLANDAMKQQKKQTKKEQLEREELIRERIKESQKYLAVLDTFGDDTIRNDFLNELNGANKLTQNEMNLLDEFNRLVKPAELGAKLEASTTDIADHLTNLIDSKNKTIASMNVTYFELRKLFDRILFSSYWTRVVVVVAPPATTTTTTSTSKEEHNVNPTEEQHNELEQNMNKLHLTEQQIPVELVQQQHEDVHLHQQQQQSLPIEQALYHQQNTSDDYVLVSSTDENLANNQSKSPNNQQAQAKTFFTTLNQADLPAHRNINEFLNKCENDDDGINFLQDSEIQLRQQQDHLNQNELNYQQQQQQGSNNFNYNQDGSHPEGQQKDNQFKQRGGNRDHNGGQNQRQYQQRPRYTDDRRMGGTGGQGSMQQPRNNGINGPLPPRNNVSGSNQTSFNGQRNPNNSYRGGSAQGNNNNNYNNNNNNNNNNRGGYNRGPSNNNQGSGFRNNNGPRPYQQRVNNHSENVHENQQPQMA